MKYAVLGLLILLVVITLGSAILSDPGYVLISLQGIAIETSLWILVGASLFVYGCLWLLIQLIRPIFTTSGRLQRWRHKRTASQRISNLSAGMLALNRGHYDTALSILQREDADQDETGLIRHLGAARAAHQLGDLVTRDQHLDRLTQMAMTHNKAARQQVELLRAEMQTTPDHIEALTYIEKQHKRYPRDKNILRTLAIVYEKAHHWQDLRRLLPKLKKQHSFPERTYQRLERISYHAWLAQLIQSLNTPDFETSSLQDPQKALLNHWKKLPEPVLSDPEFHQTHIDSLVKAGHSPIAEIVLHWLMNVRPATTWLIYLGQLPHSPSDATLKLFKQYTKDNTQPSLLSAAWLGLGFLEQRQHRWFEAERAFTASLQAQPSKAAHLGLAQVYRQLNHYEKSVQCYALGLGDSL